MPSESLEQLVHTIPEVSPSRKLNVRALALIILGIILAFSMIGGGIALVKDQNVLGLLVLPGLLLLLAGAALMLSIVGGPVGWVGSRAGRRAEVEEEEKERRRRTGDED